MFIRESAERFRPYEQTYSRYEKRKMENESETSEYHSEPEIYYSDYEEVDIDRRFSGYNPDWEAYNQRRPVRLNQVLLKWFSCADNFR